MIRQVTPPGFELRIDQDELLYSWLARYRDLLQLPASLPLVARMLGVSRLNGSVTMPMGISRGQESCTIGGMDGQTLLMQHTAFPYYASFIDRKVAGALERGMLDGCRLSNRQSSKLTKVAHHRVLLFCSRCRDRDLKGFGQTTWSRIHQMSGVFRCHIHDEPLLASDVSAGKPVVLRCCPTTDAGWGLVECPLTGDAASRIARFTAHFMQQPRKVATLTQLRAGVTELLGAAGWLHASGHVRAHLWRSFTKHFGSRALEKLGCGRGASTATSWIHDIVGAHKASHHPLKYFLLFEFFGLEPGDLLGFPPAINGDVGVIPEGSTARPRVQLEHPSEEQIMAYRVSILADVANGLLREEIQVKHTRRFRDMMAFDRTWLDATAPLPPAWSRSLKETGAADDARKDLVAAAIERLRERPDGGSPKRITLAAVAKEAGLVSFEQRKLRYPLSFSLVEASAQTVEDHRIAVLEWTARKFQATGAKPNFKVFAKSASFHPERFPALRQRAREIHEELLRGEKPSGF